MRPNSPHSIRWVAGVLFAAAWIMPLRAAGEAELKDAAGKTIIKYVIEVPPGIAAGRRHRSGASRSA